MDKTHLKNKTLFYDFLSDTNFFTC